MNYRHALLAAGLALGLAGCASYSSNYQSDAVYRDGSYYSPADSADGDYYYAPEARDDYYDYYGQDFFYGSSLYGFDGYCSVRYRYCPPFGYSQFLYPFPRSGFIITSGDNGWFDPWAGGYGYGYGYRSPYYYDTHRRHSHDRNPPPPGMQPMPEPDQYTGPGGDARASSGEPERPLRGRQRDLRAQDGMTGTQLRNYVPVSSSFGDTSRPTRAPLRMRGPTPAPLRSRPEPRPDYAPPAPSARNQSSDSSEADDSGRRSYRRRGEGG